MFAERESHAVWLLSNQGMTRLDALSYKVMELLRIHHLLNQETSRGTERR